MVFRKGMDQGPDVIELLKKLDTGKEISDDSLVSRRSRWSTLFNVIGVVLIIIGVVFFIAIFNDYRGEEKYIAPTLACISLGLNSLLFGFLINVFTDIRWFLQKIAKN